MFAQEKINHSIDMVGKRFRSPLVINILRELVASYVILAIANIPDEQRPWAIIIKRAPLNPHIELVIAPAIIRPIWPTEE